MRDYRMLLASTLIVVGVAMLWGIGGVMIVTGVALAALCFMEKLQ